MSFRFSVVYRVSEVVEIRKHEEVLAEVDFLSFVVHLLAHAQNLEWQGTIGFPVFESLNRYSAKLLTKLIVRNAAPVGRLASFALFL
jgi:hypothetical protein